VIDIGILPFWAILVYVYPAQQTGSSDLDHVWNRAKWIAPWWIFQGYSDRHARPRVRYTMLRIQINEFWSLFSNIETNVTVILASKYISNVCIWVGTPD
jgi:hypothetical protein